MLINAGQANAATVSVSDNRIRSAGSVLYSKTPWLVLIYLSK